VTGHFISTASVVNI